MCSRMRIVRRWPSADSAYKDDVAPEGSPFRPLYDDRIRFSGQPIALVVAEEWEIARFAASLVRVEYRAEAHVTDLHRQRDAAVALDSARREPVPSAEAARLGRAGVRGSAGSPRGRILRPDRAPQSDGVVRLDGDVRERRQADDLRQDTGRAERSASRRQRIRHGAGRCARPLALRGRRIRFRAASAISGDPGRAGGARAEAFGASRADTTADVWARIPAGDDTEDRARRQRRRNARRDHPRSGHGDIAIRELPPPGNRLVRSAVQVRQREIYA